MAVRVGVMFTSDRVNGVTVLLICVSLMASLRLCLLWYAAARSVITPFIVVSLFLLDQTAPFYVELFFLTTCFKFMSIFTARFEVFALEAYRSYMR